MRWAITLLIALASCLAASQPLLENRGGSCRGSICFGNSKLRPFTIKNIGNLIDQYVYEGDELHPPASEIPWTTWDRSTMKRKLRYRAYRTDGLGSGDEDEQIYETDFSVHVEVEVFSRDNLDVYFGGFYPRAAKDKGKDWESSVEGLARGNIYGRRTIFTIHIPANAAKIDYKFNAMWHMLFDPSILRIKLLSQSGR
ncbi:hypothetical protein LZ32DRAFT_615672 [Colletotrichum eremochloae]|nr:hypothetical protein LZ32DRAFT_615672 [Colletotrichum eremochloae]